MAERKDHSGAFYLQIIYPALAQLVNGLLLINEQGVILKSDQHTADRLGYSIAALESRTILELDTAMSQEKWRKYWKNLEQKTAVDLSSYWQSKSGMQLPVRIVAGLLEDGATRLALCRVHFTDLEVLLPLLQSSARFGRTAAWEWDLQKETFTVTDYFYRLFDLDPADYQLPGLNILELLRDRLCHVQLSRLTAVISRLRSQGRSFQKKLQLHWEGSKKNVLLQADPILEDQKVVRIRGLCREISDENGMKDQTKLFLDKAQTPICWITTEGHLAYANPALCLALGYSQEEILDHLSIHRIDIENSRSQWDRFRSALTEEDALTLETSFQRKDGTIFPVEMDLLALGEGLLGVLARDISLRRQEEMQLKAGLLHSNQLSRQLEAENLYLQEEVSHPFENIISKSSAYTDVLYQVEQVAPTDSTVLIEGESGTGKELLAHAIHRLSRRSHRTLVKVNCAVLPDSLIESELFGHEKGAFTGAEKRRIGRFELADGGTIFLDEIGELPLDLQAKLLRVLQEGEFERVGGNTTLSVNVRVIAATNRKLREMVNKKRFREDLFYRLNVFPIDNIPLRRRQEDIPLLTWHFLQKYSLKTGKDVREIRPKDLERLEKYDFPGNVRELENIIERAMILTEGQVLDLSHWRPLPETAPKTFLESQTMEQMQYELILATLKKTHWRVSGPDGAAARLDMHPQTLYSRMRKLGIRRKK